MTGIWRLESVQTRCSTEKVRKDEAQRVIHIATSSCEVVRDKKQANRRCHSEWHLSPKSPFSGFFASAQNDPQTKTRHAEFSSASTKEWNDELFTDEFFILLRY